MKILANQSVLVWSRDDERESQKFFYNLKKNQNIPFLLFNNSNLEVTTYINAQIRNFNKNIRILLQ